LAAFVQIYHSPPLLAFCLVYLVSISLYNACGLAVTRRLSAVHRTLIDALRTIAVWAAELAMFSGGGGVIGEPWGTYSPLQLGGFSLLIIGTLIHNGVIKLPCLKD
jgi:hypothetical protein